MTMTYIHSSYSWFLYSVTYSIIDITKTQEGNYFLPSLTKMENKLSTTYTHYDNTKRGPGVENTEDPAVTRSVASQGSLAPAGLGQAPQPLMQ